MMRLQSARRAWRIAAWLAPLALAIAAAAHFGSPRRPAQIAFETDGRTLLVLPPLAPASRHDDVALAQQFGRELIDDLAPLGDLRVIAAASSQRAAADRLDDAQLVQRTGATHLLSGRLHSDAARAHVELRLTDIRSGRVLLARTYERAIDEALALGQDIALDVARTLDVRAPAMPKATRVEPGAYRAYCEARQLADAGDPVRAIESLRALLARTPDFARAHAALARSLLRERSERAELDEAALAAQRAQELAPDLADTQIALAILACRTSDWTRCMEWFQRALALNPADAEGRIAYAYWLGALGFVEQALREADTAWRSDPLSSGANFTRGRMLDTVGRHDEARRYLESPDATAAGVVYARWHNAIWRKDLDAAPQIAVAIPRGDGFREAYLVVSEAMIEPRLWPQVLPLISTSERASGRIDVLRLLTPTPDYAVILSGLEKMLRNGWPSYYLLIWMPEYAAMRRDPAFQDFLRRTRIIDYWRAHGWPTQCRADGEGARCD